MWDPGYACIEGLTWYPLKCLMCLCVDISYSFSLLPCGIVSLFPLFLPELALLLQNAICFHCIRNLLFSESYPAIHLQVFNHLFSLQLEEDINMVLFGLCSEVCLKEDCFPEAACQLDKLLKFKHQEIGQSIIHSTKKIRRLKWDMTKMYFLWSPAICSKDWFLRGWQ